MNSKPMTAVHVDALQLWLRFNVPGGPHEVISEETALEILAFVQGSLSGVVVERSEIETLQNRLLVMREDYLSLSPGDSDAILDELSRWLSGQSAGAEK
jgi:hypothetical protein